MARKEKILKKVKCYAAIIPQGLWLLLCYVCGIWAETEFIVLSGILPATVVKAETPYLVTGALTVEEGRHTVIEKGVIFLFKNFSSITVSGTIRVEGSREEPVVFTSENDTLYNSSSILEPAAFDWDGITLNPGETENVFKHCYIQFSLFGVKSLRKNVVLKECFFLENGNADVTVEGEKLMVASPFSYDPNEEQAGPDVGESDPAVEISAQEEGPSKEIKQEEAEDASELSFNIEEPADESKPQKVPLVSPIPKEKKHRRVTLRLLSIGAALGGGAMGVIEHLNYISAREKFDRINEFGDEEKIKYTAADWNEARDKSNQHLRNALIYYGIGFTGLTVFTFSIMF